MLLQPSAYSPEKVLTRDGRVQRISDMEVGCAPCCIYGCVLPIED